MPAKKLHTEEAFFGEIRRAVADRKAGRRTEPVVSESFQPALDQLVAEDPDILGGIRCFAGTRAPIAHVLASLDKGVSLERLQASWPFLTQAHVDASRAHARRRHH
jgi:uncharacterized protein (DUF433 family)